METGPQLLESLNPHDEVYLKNRANANFFPAGHALTVWPSLPEAVRA